MSMKEYLDYKLFESNFDPLVNVLCAEVFRLIINNELSNDMSTDLTGPHLIQLFQQP
jgi:hypothetical protein